MIAYIFPGQGSQYVEMGKDLYECNEIAREIFDRADAAVGFPLSQLCFQGSQDQLTSTDNVQPAILTVSIAALEVLRSRKGDDTLRPAFAAGLSLGEYSALVAVGVLSFEEAVVLVRKRGTYMQEAAERNPGKMVSVIGLERDVVRGVCQEAGCEIANLNCPGQVVISGRAEAIDAASKRVIEKGAKRALPLAVSGAFHSSLMKEAEERLAVDINKAQFNAPVIPLVSNVTATATTDVATIKANLIKQVSSSTLWQDSVTYMAVQGADVFLEIGPGVVLKGLNRRINASLTTHTLGITEQVEAFVAGLTNVGEGV